MFMKLFAINITMFYLVIAFVIFYVKSNKNNTIEIMIDNAQAKNRKHLVAIKSAIKSDIKLSLLWPVLVGKYLSNEFKKYRNKHFKV